MNPDFTLKTTFVSFEIMLLSSGKGSWMTAKEGRQWL